MRTLPHLSVQTLGMAEVDRNGTDLYSLTMVLVGPARIVTNGLNCSREIHAFHNEEMLPCGRTVFKNEILNQALSAREIAAHQNQELPMHIFHQYVLPSGRPAC